VSSLNDIFNFRHSGCWKQLYERHEKIRVRLVVRKYKPTSKQKDIEKKRG